MTEQKKTVVLYPGVGIGHLLPMLELARGLVRYSRGAFEVAVVLVDMPDSDPGFPVDVMFHCLPPPPDAEEAYGGAEEEHPMARSFRFLRAMNAQLRDFLRSSLPSVQALVLDMFCGDALDVAAELGVPAYFFFASGGTGLAVFLGLPGRRAAGELEGGDDAVLSLPGAPPFRVSDLPSAMAAGGGEAGTAMFRMGARMPEARGILVNTFDELEPRAVRALKDGLCVPGGATPWVYCVGPLISPGDEVKGHAGCLRWLDAQPDHSVVFLCFGSMGAFSRAQLAEIAVGLENSGQRFLWVVRKSPPPAGNLSDSDAPPPVLLPSPEEELDAVLPAGFLERTKDKGLVVGGWAPQVAVLRHRAAGAFVTHCGWNSVLEGVAAGLPLLCWPLYAEQRLNKVWVVDEMRLGVEIMRRSASGADEVDAAEVEVKVRWVMDPQSDDARALRQRAAEARAAAADALDEGGSSHAGFLEFIIQSDLCC